MGKSFIRISVLFVLLIFLQIWLFNKIHLFGIATPLLYIYFLIKLPVTMNRNIVLLLSALMGFILDLFDYSLGLNMLALVFTGFLRYYVLNFLAPRDIFEEYSPSFSTFGRFLFIRYAATLILIHAAILLTVDTLAFIDPLRLLLKIVSSSLLTFLLVVTFESIDFDIVKR
ncbi:MAG: rod shape-determining protein MreD [Dysgonamonadaceae bacterium]|jgi:rod shape-determining protein MreD|nr:rod shape-determining protein MreD [Dysgonamonadaceae bacterium]